MVSISGRLWMATSNDSILVSVADATNEQHYHRGNAGSGNRLGGDFHLVDIKILAREEV